ncbi:MAG TPA: hypothetical protein VGM87_08475 [Roseomonas sp.]
MNGIKSDSNQDSLLSDREFADEVGAQLRLLIAKVDALGTRVDHVDEGVHDVQQRISGIEALIEECRPALARATALMDPGAKLRERLTGKKKS